MDFGCSKKITFNESLEYFDSDFSYILSNNGKFSDYIATTDLIFNNDLINSKDFIDISFQHANNDLLCSGVQAEYATMNLSLPYEFDIIERKYIIDFIKEYLLEKNVKLINAHTIVGNDFFISWTLISKKNKEVEAPCFLEKNIFLSKPLGASSSLNTEIMKNSNNFVLKYIDDIEYMTDISGYGLYNELNLLNKIYGIKFNIFKSNIENRFSNYESDCSIVRNLDTMRSNLNDADKKILFSSEFNGPLLIFSDLHDIKDCKYIGNVSQHISGDWFNYE